MCVETPKGRTPEEKQRGEEGFCSEGCEQKWAQEQPMKIWKSSISDVNYDIANGRHALLGQVLPVQADLDVADLTWSMGLPVQADLKVADPAGPGRP